MGQASERAKGGLVWAVALTLGLAAHAPFLPLGRGAPQARVAEASVEAQAREASRSLIDEAQGALRAPGEPFDLGSFFLRAEAEARGLDPAPQLERWARLASALRDREALRGEKHFDEGAQRVIGRLFAETSLDRYVRERAELGALLGGGAGGNCEAETKLLVASLEAAGLDLPEGRALGVQIFADHVQAVVLERASGKTWNLLTGEIDVPPGAPVYAPRILVHAFLLGAGATPEVSALDLLLHPGSPPGPSARGAGGGFRTSSTLGFPAATHRYAEGDPPERGRVAFPFPHRNGESAKASEQEGSGPIGREAFLRDNDEVHLFSMARARAPYALAKGRLVFASEADAARYRGLSSDETRRAMLLELSAEALRGELAQPALSGVVGLLSPGGLSSRGSAGLRAAVAGLARVEGLLQLAEYVCRDAFADAKIGALAVKALVAELPELRQVIDALAELPDRASDEPERFLASLSSLDEAARGEAVRFLVPRFQTPHVTALARALGDGAKIELSDRPAAIEPDTFVDVELLELPPQAGDDPAGVTAAIVGETGRARMMDRGAFADLVLGGMFWFSEPDELYQVLERWDEGVTERAWRAEADACSLRRKLERTLSPLAEAGRKPPVRLEQLARRLEAACPVKPPGLPSVRPPPRIAPPPRGPR